MHTIHTAPAVKNQAEPQTNRRRISAGLNNPTRYPVWATRLPLQASLKINAPGDRYEQEADRVADQVMRMPAPQVQRKTCSCGKPAGPDGMCDDCKRKKLGIQRMASGDALQTSAPPSVHQVLQQPGRPLDTPTRNFMESRFGRDFGDVRLHTGKQAAESADAVNARAYTVGENVVFAGGEYSASSRAGKRLLAHELSHVVQQNRMQRNELLQRDANLALDDNARRIIALAQDSSRGIEDRAVALIRAMIAQYYPSDASKISQIRWREAESGLEVTSRGRGSSTTGIITVGRYFVEHTTRRGLARRLAQLRHEIEHVEQWRRGMRGANRSDEREFLAFYHEALFVEIPHTGRISHSTRVNLIDGAIGYYHCLSSELREQNASRQRELLERRQTEAGQSGRASEIPSPPTACRRL